MFAAGLVSLGIGEMGEWAKVWRPITFIFWLGVGLVLLGYLLKRGRPALAAAAFGFWLFNRWSIDVLRIAHTDFVGVFFLVLSLVLAGRWPLVAAFLFGVSLSVKQVAILAAPIFLLTMWRSQGMGFKKLVLSMVLLLLVPLLTSLPFLLDDPQATIYGWLNAAERPAQTDAHGFAPSIDAWLGVSNVSRSAIMIFLVAIVYVAAWRRGVGLIGGTLMILAIMIAFTHVLYNQYLVWFIPLIPLAVAEIRVGRKKG